MVNAYFFSAYAYFLCAYAYFFKPIYNKFQILHTKVHKPKTFNKIISFILKKY